MKDIKTIRDAEEYTKKPNTLAVVTASDVFYYEAESEELRDHWIGAISRAAVPLSVLRDYEEEIYLDNIQA